MSDNNIGNDYLSVKELLRLVGMSDDTLKHYCQGDAVKGTAVKGTGV